jgi:hypothetical protein
MITTLRVLSIGSPETAEFVRDVLILRSRCWLCVAKCTWDLPVVSGSEEIDVAILHDTFSPRELRIFAAYIRCRWPHARILLIQEKSEGLVHGMYDERVAPGISPEPLLAVIERLGASARRERRLGLNREHTYQRPRQGKTEMTETQSILKGRLAS